VTVEADQASGDIHLVAGPHYRGIQFHAESILTQNGFGILRDLVTALIG
jgi:phenazine biosynthesis protein phzE